MSVQEQDRELDPPKRLDVSPDAKASASKVESSTEDVRQSAAVDGSRPASTPGPTLLDRFYYWVMSRL